MSTRIVHRPARSAPSSPGVRQEEVERPPQLPEDDGGGNLLTIVPMLGAGVSMTLMMFFRGSAFAAVGAIMMIVTVLAFSMMLISQRGRAARRRRQLRDRYLTYLDRRAQELGAEEERVRSTSQAAHPHPGALLSLVADPHRLWERRRDDDDTLVLRIGHGDAPAATFVRTGDDNPLQAEDEFMLHELEQLEKRYSTLPDAPVTVDLDSVGNTSIVGDAAFCRDVARTLTTQAVALHSPEDLEVALVVPPTERDQWLWLDWMPHLADQDRTTPEGPERRIARDPAHLAEILRNGLHRRLSRAAEMRRALRGSSVAASMARLWVVSDCHGRPATNLLLGDREATPADLGITMLHLLADRADEPDDITVRISQHPTLDDHVVLERYTRRDREPEETVARLDLLGPAETRAVARRLAGLRLSPDSLEHDAVAQATRAADLLGLGELTDIDLERAWAPRPLSSFLRVQIGTDDQGDPVMLDLKESAQFGMGPHGLAIGATGSGKSELLRTLVLGLCAGHAPTDVNLVLVDYKGGAAFAPFASVPHVSGVITNLGDDAALVERVHASLSGEVTRRQEVLKAAGDLPNITAYRRAQRESLESSEPMEPLPHLVVIIDEFGELLTARPDFIDLFLSIGRIGRSVGIHLLLSSQRIEAGKLKGLETYLSYRLGLRTLSEAESRTVLDTLDAFSLPPAPGWGYLKVDTTTYTRFRAGYVSGALPGPEDEATETGERPVLKPMALYASSEADAEAPEETPAAPQADEGSGGLDDEEESGPTVLSTVVEQLQRAPRRTSPIWLPRLPDALTLDEVDGAPAPTRHGLRIPRPGPLSTPIGRLDDPGKQWQGPDHLDLASAGGHVLVVGAPRTGKTTALLTLATSLALTHRPDEVTVYGLDLVGSGLAPLDGLPNVAGIATRLDHEVVRRTVEEVHSAMHRRETLLQRYQVPDLTSLRARAQEAGEEPHPDAHDVVLLIDGIGQLSEEFDEIESPVRDLVRRGAGLGVHVVVTATRPNELRMNLQTYFGHRLELRLGDPGESHAGRRRAETLTAGRPGRYLTADGLTGQLALPRIDGEADASTLTAGLAALVESVRESATQRAGRVRLLPAVVTPDQLEQHENPALLPLGLRERDLQTQVLDLDRGDRNLLLIGDNETGRTSTLKFLMTELMERHTPQDLVFAVFDPRRSLQGFVPEDYLGGYAPSSMLAERLVAAMLPELEKRVPADVDGELPDEAPAPRVVVVADDYDVLTAGGVSPLAPLRPLAAMSREINLSVVLARRTAGASRGMHEPLTSTVVETGGTTLLFSGDRSEGIVVGTHRPAPLPTGRARLIRTGQPVVTVQVATGEGVQKDQDDRAEPGATRWSPED